MTVPVSAKDLLFTELMRVAAAASVAALLARFRTFRSALFGTPRHDLRVMLMLVVPFSLGVVLRLFGYPFADLSLEGALLTGLVAGRLWGPIGGTLIALPALTHGELLGVLLGAVAGLTGGAIRDFVPDRNVLWDFGPFTFLSVPRRLLRSWEEPEGIWPLLPLGACVLLELARPLLTRWFPGRSLFFLPAGHPWLLLLDLFATVFAVATPIKIWNSIRLELNLQENQRMLLKARMDALTSQINPHFLFNTLNTVASLVRQEPDRAREVVIKLSNILRRILRQHDTFVPLREELAFIDDYLDIEVARFGTDKLRFVREVDRETLDAFVPTMLLQPIVENAVRHGLAPRLEGGEIRLRTHRQSGRLVVEVEDNGIGISPVQLEEICDRGIGIRNVRERLRLLYGNDFQFEITSRPGEGTRIHIEIPELTQALPETGAVA